MVRDRGVLSILTSKSASRHRGVQFLISPALASLLLDPAKQKKIVEKTQCFATFLPFRAHASLFHLTLSLLWSSLFFSSPLWLCPPLLFHLPLLSEVWLLSFLRWMSINMYSLVCILSIYMCVYHMCLYMPLWPSFTTHMCMWYFLHLYYYIHRLCILFCVYVCMSYFLTLYATFFMYICTYCNTCCNASTC